MHAPRWLPSQGVTFYAEMRNPVPATFKHKTTGETVQTTDPGRALITGKWRDMARFKGPILRGLAGRAPYFHNGLAKDLDEAVEFYEFRPDTFTASGFGGRAGSA
jgi:cytochrome c peroxidase